MEVCTVVCTLLRRLPTVVLIKPGPSFIPGYGPVLARIGLLHLHFVPVPATPLPCPPCATVEGQRRADGRGEGKEVDEMDTLVVPDL
jgi:hypothetical protein